MYEFLQKTVADHMTRAVRTVTPETRVGNFYRLFAADDFDAYPVVSEDRLLGVVSKLDALKVFALAEDRILPRYVDGMDITVNEIMTTDIATVSPATNLQRVL